MDNCHDYKLPNRPNQGSAAKSKETPPVKSGMPPGPSKGGSEVKPPAWTPGRGTRGKGTTANPVPREGS